MAILSVAPHVHQNVGPKRLAPFNGKPRGPGACFGVLAIHVKDWRVRHFGDVGAVTATKQIFCIRGETHLIVNDHMNGAAHGEAGKQHHVETFRDNTLTRKRGVTVNKNWHNTGAVFSVIGKSLLGAAATHDHA